MTQLVIGLREEGMWRSRPPPDPATPPTTTVRRPSLHPVIREMNTAALSSRIVALPVRISARRAAPRRAAVVASGAKKDFFG